MKPRDKLEIIKDMLEFCLNVPKRQSVINSCVNIQYPNCLKILDLCLGMGLLETVPLKGYSGKGFLTTSKGKEYIKTFYALTGMLFAERKVPQK